MIQVDGCIKGDENMPKKIITKKGTKYVKELLDEDSYTHLYNTYFKKMTKDEMSQLILALVISSGILDLKGFTMEIWETIKEERKAKTG